jgi:predicted component of viral defense system (DUF524 family)
VPAALAEAFAPATWILREWDEYWLRVPGADRLRVGTTWLQPEVRGLFRVQFANQLGLTTLQPFRGEQPLHAAVHAEVLSRKFPSPAAHLAFLRALLAALAARLATLPFAPAAPTAQRTVADASSAPLFVLHFLLQRGSAVRSAVRLIEAAPQRALTEHAGMVPLAEAAELDAEVLLATVQASSEWTAAPALARAGDRLGGRAPVRAWQRRVQETFDTPENRFARRVLDELLTAASALPTAHFWTAVPEDHRRALRTLVAELRASVQRAPFAGQGASPPSREPTRALQGRAGYRELLALAAEFRRGQSPLFAAVDRALALRDVARLYEAWVFFALAEQLGRVLEVAPVFALDEALTGGAAGAEARFGSHGTLRYNAPMTSYSGPLRPDFAWVREGRTELVFDAKFRLDPADLDPAGERHARREDLDKMHTYRDALGVRAAVCIHPGDASVFYARDGGRHTGLDLSALLRGELHGIGALALTPGVAPEAGP